jgi:uncharacterized protein YbbC (DUF1343 family)
MKKFEIFFVLVILFAQGISQNPEKMVVGAEQPEIYLPLLENKTVGLVANHTSLVKNTHLLDFLLSKNIKVGAVFAPEHGFRGEAAAGSDISDGKDTKTGVRIFSLYGESKKPTPGQLRGIEMMVFDIQDVGCRFYTYISTLHYVVEACAENNIPLIVLDRPNPNGDYVAGPVLEKAFTSFVGVDPIPVVHGCTVGELALMINGEGWLQTDKKCDIRVVQVKGYSHKMHYSLPVPPSPNLPNDLAVRLYPSLCFFEATSVSIGRGTGFPFQAIGYPDKRFGGFSFMPIDLPGVASKPIQEGKLCYGEDLRKLKEIPEFTLKFFLEYYNKFEDKTQFLTRENWLNLLAGTNKLAEQIRKGTTETEIENSWKDDLDKYKKIREKYLLYTDSDRL